MFVRHVRSSAEAAGDAIHSCRLHRVRGNPFDCIKLDELAQCKKSICSATSALNIVVRDDAYRVTLAKLVRRPSNLPGGQYVYRERWQSWRQHGAGDCKRSRDTSVVAIHPTARTLLAKLVPDADPYRGLMLGKFDPLTQFFARNRLITQKRKQNVAAM
jgi:hypothetical protein